MFFVASCRQEEPAPAPVAVEAPAPGVTAAKPAMAAPERGARPGEPAPATNLTASINAKAGLALPIDDQKDFEDARRGLLASEKDLLIAGPSPGDPPVWRASDYAFVEGEAPPSVNPSLWRQARLNGIHGLFEVTAGIYQVRGYDVSNISFIRGKSGWIVVDPLTVEETAAAALALFRKHLGTDPIVAVIFTHSHVDHFGGIGAVLADAHTDASKLRVIAPQGFLEESTSENVLAGVAMGRRASFMYGTALPRSPLGHVDTGLGKQPPAGTISIVEPTELVGSTPQDLDIDGVPFRFQYTPNSEAPAEMTFYLPASKAFCGAEVVSRNMHNLYTLRGAKVRDALKWSGYIDEAIRLFPDMEIVFASHHWPAFGKADAIGWLSRQRDVYRFLHDQTLRLANSGLGPQEIAETLTLPASLQGAFSERGYYGTLRHNVKAVYQNYFGWYDANPANLDPLPPEEAAKRYVEAMGGAGAVMQKATEAFERGDYRWAAMMLNHLVFADSANQAARELLARNYEQLGYQAESGPWRDVYLTGAFELRRGPQPPAMKPQHAAALLRHLELDRFFDAMAARLDATKAEGRDLRLNFVFVEPGSTQPTETHVLHIVNSVLHHEKRDPDPAATATVKLTHDFLVRLSVGLVSAREMIFSNDLDIDGSRIDLASFFAMLDKPTGEFAIVTP